ncbi:Multicopper oxidase type 1 [Botryosphaeria dothidea]|uniref:Multicopper oxidase type 1 n=1 Tax=Botryosphaeria dothidea TaxID=55169 RepID=A0A8H4J0I0_9PEZI|nr:Multicopper oxidase type 1 [Botryosphaeria dothidea]
MFSIFSKPSSGDSFVEVASIADSNAEAAQQNADVPEKKVIGSVTEIRSLYEGPHDEDDNWEFQAEYPEDLIRKGPPPGKIPPNKLYSLVVHHERTGLKSKPLRMASVTVQSPHVKRVFCELFKDHHNIGDMRLRNPVFKPPYRELYYVWPQFEEAVEKETDPVASEHLQLFHSLVKKDVQRMRNKQLPLDKQHKATFDTLFTYFQPGQVVYHKVEGYDRFFKVFSAEYSSHDRPSCMTVDYAELEWDGVRLGWKKKTFDSWRFPGSMKVTELKMFPAELHPQYEKIKARLLQRGKRWEAMMKPTVVEYEGPTPETIEADRWGRGGGTRMVKGRVVIDPAAYEAYGSRSIPLTDVTRCDEYFKPMLDFDSGEDDDDDDDEVAKPATEEDSESESDDEESNEQETEEKTEAMPEDKFLNDDRLLLASHVIYGCNLKSKAWVSLFIDIAKDVPWNYDAFDRLVLPGKYKELMLAFVESQATNRDVFDDVIEGKGQGIIMLLHGAPGLGKTLTAEAVSDRLKKPLYSVQAGELGSEASDVETKLEQILEIAAKWDAVLLLDEADVFLEQRSHSNLKRSKIVSVFLRLLEYYRGILFLTTNRVETFDKAFRSRIHLRINYPGLDTEAKTGIWKNFIEASKKKNGSTVTEDDIAELSKLPFNGREIKNMVKTAQLLASREKQLLEMKHFRICLEVMEDEEGEKADEQVI